MKKISDFDGVVVPFEELSNPDEYKKFIKWMPKYADCICVSCLGLDYEEFKNSKWGFLCDSIIDYEYTVDSPVTSSPTMAFMLLYLEINHITYQWLQSKKHIYDYMDAMIEEGDYFWLYDLCLIKNKKLQMCSCTHEEFCYISEDMLKAYKLEK